MADDLAPDAPPARAHERPKPLDLLKRQLRRPVVLGLAVLAGVTIVAPRFGPREVTFHHRLPPRGCAEALRLRAYEGQQTVRSSARIIRDETEISNAFLLPKGRYVLKLDLLCARGSTRTIERTLLLEENDAMDFDLSRECPC